MINWWIQGTFIQNLTSASIFLFSAFFISKSTGPLYIKVQSIVQLRYTETDVWLLSGNTPEHEHRPSRAEPAQVSLARLGSAKMYRRAWTRVHVRASSSPWSECAQHELVSWNLRSTLWSFSTSWGLSTFFRVSLFTGVLGDKQMRQEITVPGKLGSANVPVKFPATEIFWENFKILYFGLISYCLNFVLF